MNSELIVPKNEKFWWINIAAAVFLSAVLYCLLNASELFSSLICMLFSPGRGGRPGRFLISEDAFVTACVYGRDFLWSFALVFAVSYLMRGSLSGMKQAFTVVMLFEAVILLWEAHSPVYGMFDLKSLAAVAVGDFIAFTIILIHERLLI